METIPPMQLEALVLQKIYFGHMSVGFNIIEGISDIKEESPDLNKLNIAEVNAFDTTLQPALYHGRIGKNGFPNSKLQNFKEIIIDKKAGDTFDIAFFKFCYVDFNPDTDVQSIFEKYVKVMNTITLAYPALTLIHVTAPYTVHAWNFKHRIRNLIKGDLANVKRNKFNALLRNHYTGKAPIFDLAQLESTLQDKSRSTFTFKGDEHECLARQFTYDGGHLNKHGRMHVSKGLLALLLDLSKETNNYV